jgi:hypothetical protein
VADEMCDPLLEKWHMADQTRIDTLSLSEYISKMAALVLEVGWSGKLHREVMGAHMPEGKPFADWAYEIQASNAILITLANSIALTDEALLLILDAGLSPDLQEELNINPPIATSLAPWIAEVKTRDDKLQYDNK